ncbi:DUF3592 domain-containing protein [Crocosphaera sp. Alani8]|uniref:DUF3592 domain-containing protein n=1 Tax=Crocosphaera sp. Alani8 TaxID=3038952 RepID=UPI00313E6B84
MNLIFSILCLIFLIVTLWFGVYNYLFLKEALAIEGKVVGLDRSITRTSASSSSQNSYPIIEYINPLTQEKKKFKASVAALNVKIGTLVWVAYRQKTQTEKLISFGEILIPSAIFGLFGLTLLLILFPLSQSRKIVYWLLRIFHIF